jgi:hypothetical protein
MNFAAVLRRLRAENPRTEVTIRFPVNSGKGNLGRLREGLETYCLGNDIELDIRESKGFLISTLGVVLVGPAEKLIPLIEWLDGVQRGGLG